MHGSKRAEAAAQWDGGAGSNVHEVTPCPDIPNFNIERNGLNVRLIRRHRFRVMCWTSGKTNPEASVRVPKPP